MSKFPGEKLSDYDERIAEHERAIEELKREKLIISSAYAVKVPKSVKVPVYPEGIRIHAKSACKGRACVFHKPSKHHMVTWPIIVRLDRFGALCERRCEHGIGHPDPDSLAYIESLWIKQGKPENAPYEGIHGCDGCCHPEGKKL